VGGKLKALVVGSGGREHAIVWALSRSPQIEQIIVAPGNAGTARSFGCRDDVSICNADVPAADIPGLVRLAQRESIDLTIVGPEVPLAVGLVDAFQEVGRRVFGPARAAARLESSKAFSKAFMVRHNIPTGKAEAFDEYEPALVYLRQMGSPVVVKADGLAAGKGVLICNTLDEAESALEQVMLDRAFGGAGDRVVIEEFLTGPEVSLLAFCDGKTVVPMLPARDHKRAYDNDEGPNTGGMGAFAPAPDVTPELVDEICRTVLQPTVDGMRAEGTPYVGVLYGGIMLTDDGLKVLEFNCRFGDPETQVILPLLQTDIVDIFQACIDGRLAELDVKWNPGACGTVVLASPGYPGSYPKGLPISGVESVTDPDTMVFHAGTAWQDGQLVTAGGRVLAVSAVGDDLPAALDRAYAGVQCIHFDGMHYRQDIGKQVR
jgi:phosphoribosylamine--glycine ligase